MSTRNLLLQYFHYPKLCKNIKLKDNPWGWKSKNDIQKIIDYPIKIHNINFNDFERKFIHEYKLKEHCESIYYKTYYGYINDFNFLNSPLFSIKLSIALNDLRSQSDIFNLDEDINVKNVTILNSWIKYGSIQNKSKFLGYYNTKEIIHEICTGALGPEIQNIWDQKGIKQKVRLLIKLDDRKDVFDFERDLMYENNNWQLCNINRIIV